MANILVSGEYVVCCLYPLYKLMTERENMLLISDSNFRLLCIYLKVTYISGVS